MFDGVFDQVGKHLSEQLLVAREIEFRLDAAPKVLACVLCHRDIDFDDALEKGRWLNEPEARAPAAGFDLRNSEESGEGRKNAFCFADRPVDDTPRIGGIA